MVQNVSGITTRQGELFPGAETGPQFYPVSAIDDLTAYLMTFGNGGAGSSIAANCPLRLSRTCRKEIPEADIDRWSIDSDTSVGRLRHLGPTEHLSETPPNWARPSIPLGYNKPVCPTRQREGKKLPLTQISIRGAWLSRWEPAPPSSARCGRPGCGLSRRPDPR